MLNVASAIEDRRRGWTRGGSGEMEATFPRFDSGRVMGRQHRRFEPSTHEPESSPARSSLSIRDQLTRQGYERYWRLVGMKRWPAYFTYDPDMHLYYFAPVNRTKPPYLKQIEVRAIIDIASDGTLAGVELIEDMPEMPINSVATQPDGQ